MTMPGKPEVGRTSTASRRNYAAQPEAWPDPREPSLWTARTPADGLLSVRIIRATDLAPVSDDSAVDEELIFFCDMGVKVDVFLWEGGMLVDGVGDADHDPSAFFPGDEGRGVQIDKDDGVYTGLFASRTVDFIEALPVVGHKGFGQAGCAGTGDPNRHDNRNE